MATYTSIQGQIRLYDGSATPYYVALTFDEGNLSAPSGRARPEETAIFHRGRGAKGVHYISGPDAPILEPLELTFGLRVQNVLATAQKFRAAMCNPDLAATWEVDGDTWVSTKGDFTLTDGDGNSFTDPAFADSKKVCVNVEILWTLDSVAYGFKYGAVYFPPDQQSLAESEEGVIISATGLIYGTITEITSFTFGTES